MERRRLGNYGELIARQLLEDHLRSSTPILQELLKKQQENP